MKFLKNFFFEVGEWFADASDNWRLWVVKNKIDNLKGWFGGGAQWYDLEDIIELHIEAREEILARINARETRHSQKQAVMR